MKAGKDFFLKILKMKVYDWANNNLLKEMTKKTPAHDKLGAITKKKSNIIYK